MTFDPLTSDFYGFENALAPHELDALSRLRGFMESEIAPIADRYWERAEFPHQIIRPLLDTGVASWTWPETRDTEYSAVFRGFASLEMSRVDASISTFIGVQEGLAMGAIGECGSPEQRADWLPRMARGEIIGAFGLTEPLSGSDSARGLRTTATRDGDEWVLSGSKRWIGNATFSDITVIWAKDSEDGQVIGFIVPTDADGYTATAIGNKISLRMVQNADITLNDVRVGDHLRLTRARSFADTARVLRLTRAGVAWSSVGVAIGAYEAALAYATERVQFGKPIAAHQLIQDLLARCLGNITASIALCVRVSQMLDDGVQRDEHSALAKSFCTSRMRETVAWAREIMGGNGIVLDYGAARHFADAEALYSYEGTREMNALIVGRAVTGHAAFV
ncbi:acyl-CoA dehydrogenase family protein [Mycetocola reblochoni]|uniref:Glutaryl-CoA dehydrogenase n=2 Tax=Mycetocola reblochoni TaxID=331618 RepID=A0A1R4K1T6_9MICO|nr:acyl-CoA dehydrogenase family protein [Mycetocola reblochoni]RLP70456.1 acyl-CoA dehydrogenase [Mycetocola reblochoni]SJN38015.1 Glutaryl-CoA dehydrogenase [Mycetocola reblochoni REB411]